MWSLAGNVGIVQAELLYGTAQDEGREKQDVEIVLMSQSLPGRVPTRDPGISRPRTQGLLVSRGGRDAVPPTGEGKGDAGLRAMSATAGWDGVCRRQDGPAESRARCRVFGIRPEKRGRRDSSVGTN